MLKITAIVYLIEFLFHSFTGGLLACKISSSSGNNSHMAVLDMGENLTLKCSAGQLQNKTTSLEWEKQYVSIATNESFIHIVNSTWKDAGKYTCGVFYQSNLTLCSFLVKVRSPPHIKFGLYDGRYDVFRLPCYAKGYFKPDWVRWYKDDVQILSNSSEFEILNRNIDKNLYESSLLKNYPNVSDTGKYSCEAGNVYGKSRKLHFYLSKRKILGYYKYPCPRFKNEQTERNVTIDAGSSKSIICKVSYHKYGNNRAKFVMLKKINASLFPILPNQDNMSVFTIEKKESGDAMVYLMNLTFINSTKSDDGTFFCAVIMSGNPECESLYKQFNVKVITHDVKSTKKRSFNLKLVLIVSILGAVSGFLLLGYVGYLRRKIKMKFYNNCPEEEPELRWDVFVSYSSHDFSWVDNLCQLLESPPFNLIVCVHQRDWELGRSIVDNMVDSVYCSRKTLIIVSKNYVQSDYCLQELQIAMHSELMSDILNERIVLIKIDDVSMQQLPRAIRQRSYLDCTNPEHARYLRRNLLRSLPCREHVIESREHLGEEESVSSCESNDVRLQEF